MSEPAAGSLEQFVESVVSSGLMSRPAVVEFHREFRTRTRDLDSAEELAKELVRSRKLTKFQASAIYQGKTQGLIFGEYVVLDRLGEAGRGKVFRARHRTSGRIMAIKVMSTAAMKSLSGVERFRTEARAVALQKHPNVVSSQGSGEVDGLPFLLLEYRDGEDLRSRLQRRGPLPLAEVVDFAIQVSEGLEHIHGNGVIHCGIEPSNLILDPSGRIMIVDFGLARFTYRSGYEEPEELEPKEVLGLPEYMSPEQFIATCLICPASDVYSLGCTIYCLITGSPPFNGRSAAEMSTAHLSAPIPRLKDHRPDAPNPLQDLVIRMLDKIPDGRFQSAAEVTAALQALRKKHPELRLTTPAVPTVRQSSAATSAPVNNTRLLLWLIVASMLLCRVLTHILR